MTNNKEDSKESSVPICEQLINAANEVASELDRLNKIEEENVELKKKLAKFERDQKDQEEETAKSQKENAELKKQLAEFKKAHKAQEEKTEAYKTELADLTVDQLSKKQQEVNVLKEQFVALTDKLTKAEENNQSLAQALQYKDHQIKLLAGQLEGAQQTSVQLGMQVNELKKSLESPTEDTSQIILDESRETNKINELNKKLIQLRARVKELIKYKESYLTQKKELECGNKELKEKLERENKELKEKLERENNELKEKLLGLEKEKSQLETRCDQLKKQQSDDIKNNPKHKELEVSLNKTQEVCNRLKEELQNKINEITQLKSRTQKDKQSLDDKEKKINKLENQCKKLQQQIVQAADKKSIIEVNQLKAKYESLATKHQDKLKYVIETLGTAVPKLLSTLEELNKDSEIIKKHNEIFTSLNNMIKSFNSFSDKSTLEYHKSLENLFNTIKSFDDLLSKCLETTDKKIFVTHKKSIDSLNDSLISFEHYFNEKRLEKTNEEMVKKYRESIKDLNEITNLLPDLMCDTKISDDKKLLITKYSGKIIIDLHNILEFLQNYKLQEFQQGVTEYQTEEPNINALNSLIQEYEAHYGGANSLPPSLI